MTELKYLDSLKINGEQAINLATKHIPIAIQAYEQTAQPIKFLRIWEKLDELENLNEKQSPTSSNNQDKLTPRFNHVTQRQNQNHNSNYPTYKNLIKIHTNKT